MTKTDDSSPADGAEPDGGATADESTDNPDVISYDDVSFTDQAGFKPMIGILAVVLISFALLVGLPMYSEPGDGEFTLFTYTSIIWGVTIILCGFAYEFWLMKIEEGSW